MPRRENSEKSQRHFKLKQKLLLIALKTSKNKSHRIAMMPPCKSCWDWSAKVRSMTHKWLPKSIRCSKLQSSERSRGVRLGHQSRWKPNFQRQQQRSVVWPLRRNHLCLQTGLLLPGARSVLKELLQIEAQLVLKGARVINQAERFQRLAEAAQELGFEGQVRHY